VCIVDVGEGFLREVRGAAIVEEAMPTLIAARSRSSYLCASGRPDIEELVEGSPCKRVCSPTSDPTLPSLSAPSLPETRSPCDWESKAGVTVASASPGAPAVPSLSSWQAESEDQDGPRQAEGEDLKASPLAPGPAEEEVSTWSRLLKFAGRSASWAGIGSSQWGMRSRGMPPQDAPSPSAQLRQEAMRRCLQEELDLERQRKEEAETERRRAQEETDALRQQREVESQGLRRLEAQLASEQRRAELEAEGRQRLEDQLEAERLQKEEAAQAEELARMRAEEEAQSAHEAAWAAELQRREAERSASVRAVEEQRLRDEERARLAGELRLRAGEARQEREERERVKAFLAAHGYRHIRARCASRTLALTYPLHCVVWRNDAEMAQVLLQTGADPSQKNMWGQTPHRYAQCRNQKGSHEKVMSVLAAAAQ